MTVSYSKQVSTASFMCFIFLLKRWRGSIYKFVWKDFAAFGILYSFISLFYRYVLNEEGKSQFQHLAAYCEKYNNLIPVAFILGFYVSIVVSRYWQQLDALPWPNSMATFVGAMIHGVDAKGRKIRRTIMRYLTLTYILTMRDISPPVRRRFRDLKHITDYGLMTEDEQKYLTELSRPNRKYNIISDNKFKSMSLAALDNEIDNDQQDETEAVPNVYYAPLLWAADLVNQAYAEGRIKDAVALKTIIQEINNYRGQCGSLFMFDWISVPLVYTQVVTIAVYTFFVSCLLGRQHLDEHQGDLYFPVFTYLQFIFYMGWLKVAECLLNPFGGDDDDFEINPLIESNLQVAFTMVDELCDFSPPLVQDNFFDDLDVDIPYNKKSEQYRAQQYQGSAVETTRKKSPHDDDDVFIKKTNKSTQQTNKTPGVGGMRPITVGDVEHGVRTTQSGVRPSATQTTRLSEETYPLLPSDDADRKPSETDEAQPLQQPQRPGASGGQTDDADNETRRVGQAGVDCSQAFIDQVHQSLRELRLGTRGTNAYNRAQFFNNLQS